MANGKKDLFFYEEYDARNMGPEKFRGFRALCDQFLIGDPENTLKKKKLRDAPNSDMIFKDFFG